MAITWRRTALLAATVALTTGCLLKHESHTWYLEPGSGEVTWAVLELDVRSDAKAVADRTMEELTYWNEVQAENHSTARAFRELGGLGLRTRVLRSRVPFSVVTDATFPTIDELGRRLIALTGLSGTSVLERDGDAVQWTLTVRDPHAEDPPSSEDVSGLLGGLNTLRVVLTDGRFESGIGFTFDADRRVARFEEPDDETGENAMIVLQLSWTAPNGLIGSGRSAAGSPTWTSSSTR
jgi:hypothetical protein